MDHENETLYQSILKFLVPLEPEEVHKTIVNEAMGLVGADFGSIHLEINGDLERVYASNPTLYKLKPRKRGLLYTTYKKNKPHILAVSEIKKIHPHIRKFNVKSDIIIPLSYQNKAIGIISVLTKDEKKFTQKAFNTLKLFGPFATLAIIKAQSYKEATEALELRDLFISIASHELRTPLTSITTYTEIARKQISNGKNIDPRMIDKLLNGVIRLTKLINEFLEVDQIRSGKLMFNYEPCNLITIIKREITQFEIMFPNRKLVFKNKLKRKTGIVKADETKVQEVIDNLINNSIKFSPSNSRITLSLEYRKPNFVFFINDKGNGIPKKDLPHIFEQFYKGSTPRKDGMGLGLYLVKKIIDEHKGTISVKSNKSEGTTFTIVMPSKV